MYQIAIALGIVVWQLSKRQTSVQPEEKNDSIRSVEDLRETQVCPSGLCEIQIGKGLKRDCMFCGLNIKKKDYLKEKTESESKVLTLEDTADLDELESFTVSAPIIINTEGGISYQEFELEPKTLEGLANFAVIMHFAKLFDYYDGLTLDEGGFSLMMVDYWKLLGLGQIESENLVYCQGRFPESHESLLYEFWFKS